MASVYVIEVGFGPNQGGHLLQNGTVGAGVVRTFEDRATAEVAARELLRDFPGCTAFVDEWGPEVGM